MSCKALSIACAPLLVAGCSTMNKPIGSEDPGFGEAARYNAAVQVVNPDPIYPADSAQAGDSGAKAAAAVKRYRTDAVKQVETMDTTSGGSGGPR